MKIRPAYFALGVSLCLPAACGGVNADRSTEAACAMVVTKALDLLPPDVRVDVQKIESGRSGSAVSCSVTGTKMNVLIDATVTCRGSANELSSCTTIDAIHDLKGQTLYEK